MMMMPHMHAIETPFANFWWYICVLVFCVSVVTAFLFADKFVPQITMWNTCNLPMFVHLYEDFLPTHRHTISLYKPTYNLNPFPFIDLFACLPTSLFLKPLNS